MYDRRVLTDAQINQELLGSVLNTPVQWVVLTGLLGIVVAGAASAVGFMINQGLGVTGLNQPVYWGFMIANFVFWAGISLTGILISGILRLTQAEWRRPLTRVAETMTVFALMTSLLMPLIHAGRPWRNCYWIFPYDWARGVYPDVRSPLVWDPTAITTYLIASTLFVATTLIPDLALIRDRTTGWRKAVYGMLAMGWRGTSRQWKLQGIVGFLLSALILPVFVSVHSIVSWDFAMSLVPFWHLTVFAPLFVMGAVVSGVAAVMMLLTAFRQIYHLQNYVWEEHIDALARLLVVVAITWQFFFWLEFINDLWSTTAQDLAPWQLLMFAAPWSWLFLIFYVTAFVIPVTMFMIRKVRRNFLAVLWISIGVNVGMWLERLLVVEPGIMVKGSQTFEYVGYKPSPIEETVLAGTVALVPFLLLLFSKFFPILSISDIKEGQVLRDQVQVGNVEVPALVKE